MSKGREGRSKKIGNIMERGEWERGAGGECWGRGERERGEKGEIGKR